ncbi:flagellar assembly protein FliW [Paenibacillus abyssi]|uniref:Flagellar assembly factor FliW n=1 Tax=Paenibacillus abyssi TaxID=1340531 RepID=A0A917FNM9_9BACL|nr:flagellar assembly protein FliW [Paenibacillus abyssi]GGF91513.1 flagellar assembly factor FliW [Paenibacillus abyssi]
MIVNSAVLGEVEVRSEDIINFPGGMPGFEQLKSFVLIKPEAELPFSYLQSVEEGDIAFLLTDPFIFYANYEFQLNEHVLEELSIEDPADVLVWSIVTLKEDLQSATLNLLAPVIINTRINTGRQIILQHTSYTTKHALIVEAAEDTNLIQTSAANEPLTDAASSGNGE